MPELFFGEWRRSLDERFRLTLPTDWATMLAGDAGQCTLAKERPGCVSLWHSGQWEQQLAAGVDLLASKIRSGRLERRVESVQQLGRLLSTRHHAVPIAGRGRISIPENVRDFLGVEGGGETIVVGAAVCVEIWRPESWGVHIGAEMPQFRQLFDQLTE